MFNLNKIPEETKVLYLQTIAIAGLITSLLLSAKAWSTERSFPLSPVFSGPEVSAGLHDGLFLITILSLAGGLFRTQFRKYLIALGLVSLLTLVSLDINRLQPWVLHYFAILFLFSSFVSKRFFTALSVLNVARIIVGGIYFWSGIQKINYRFFTEIFPWFTEHLWSPFGLAGAYTIVFIGLFVPFIESFFALGLFTRKFRNISITGSVLMLIVVLSSIGPFGHGWNSSVWPWNIAIFSMVILLFYGYRFSFSDFINQIRGNWLAYMMIFVFWIMPAGNLFGLTDNYLSWSLYSGKVPEASIQGNQEFLLSISQKAKDGELTFVQWTLDDLNLVPYPENRVFLDVFKNLCTNNTTPLTLTIREYPDNEVIYECNSID